MKANKKDLTGFDGCHTVYLVVDSVDCGYTMAKKKKENPFNVVVATAEALKPLQSVVDLGEGKLRKDLWKSLPKRSKN